MKSLKKEIKLYILTKLLLWAVYFVPKDCPEIAEWFTKFPMEH